VLISSISLTDSCSPWVCNCGHSWSSHTQSVVEVDHSAILSRLMGVHGVCGEEEREGGVSGLGQGMVEVMDMEAMRDMDQGGRKDGMRFTQTP
jgi:hypothetical protein